MSDLPEPPAPLLTAHAVAGMLRVSVWQVYYLAREQGLPSIRVSSRVLRFDPAAVTAWLAARSAGGAA